MNKRRLFYVGLSFLPTLLVIALLVFARSSAILAGDPPPEDLQGFVGAQVAGKPCEILVSQNEYETAYALNPELTSAEVVSCTMRIKRALVAEEESRRSQNFVPGELLVTLERNMEDAKRASVLSGMEVLGELPQLNTYRVKVPQGQERQRATLLNTNSAVMRVEPNYIARATPLDASGTSEVLSSSEDWALQAINARQAQSVVACDPSLGVAVIGTGGVLTHPEVSNAVLVWNWVDGNADARDYGTGHELYVASRIVGNSLGVCPGGLAAFYKVLDGEGYGSYFNIAMAVLSATVDPRIKVINLSLGGEEDSGVLREAIGAASAAGKPVFIASGNGLGNEPEYPARYAKVITNAVAIGAVRPSGWLALFSNRFGSITRAGVAPGVDVIGADLAGGLRIGSGTSASAPMWAGAALLLFADPALSTEQILDALFDSTVYLPDTSRHGMGLLNVGGAVQKVLSSTVMYNLPPNISWLLPWPARVSLGREVELAALIQDPEGDALSAWATIVSSSGDVFTRSMTYDGEMWSTHLIPESYGGYTFTVAAFDGASTGVALDIGYFEVVSSGLPTGWSQHGRFPEGGSFIPYSIALTPTAQVYDEWNNLSAANKEGTAGMYGRGDAPVAVRIVSSYPCPLGGQNWGRRWLFDLREGVYRGYTNPYPNAVEMSCYQGVGMFPNEAAANGSFLLYDEGTSGSPLGRLQLVDSWGYPFWLTQLGYYSHGAVKLAYDPENQADFRDTVFVVGSAYSGMWAVSARTGVVRWFFHPDGMSSIGATPAVDVHRGIVVVKVYGNVTRGVYALDIASGDVAWHYDDAGYNAGDSAPMVVGEQVIFCDGNSRMHALDVNTGIRRWMTPVGSFYCDSTPAAIGHRYAVIYAEEAEGYGAALHVLSLETGEILASTQVVDYGSAYASPVVVGADAVLLSNYDGKVFRYEVTYSDGVPSGLVKVWEGTVDPYSGSNWQASAFLWEDQEGLSVLTVFAGINGRLRGWKWKVREEYVEPALRLTKEASGVAYLGEAVPYTVTLENTSYGNVYLHAAITDTNAYGDQITHTVVISPQTQWTWVYSSTPTALGTYTNVVEAVTLEGVSASAWATTVILRRPTPSLSITKTVEPALVLPLGSPLTYTIVISNSGDADAHGVIVSDTLPIAVVGTDLYWTGTVTAGEQVALKIPAMVTTTEDYRGVAITNTVEFVHSTGSGRATVPFFVERMRLFIPAVLREG